MMQKSFACAFMSFCTCLAFAQSTATLSGRIADEQGEVVPGITVAIKEVPIGAVTDEMGRYSIGNIPAGTHIVEVSGVGYEKHSFELTFKADDQLTRSITLKESKSELDEVIVTAESEGQQLTISAKSVQVIDTREVKIKSADLGTVMAQTEGVNVQRAGGLGSDTRFSLNGLSGDQVRFFYDGIPLHYTPYAFGIANVPVNMIDRVEIYKGVVPIEFGADALGGAVNLAPPDVYNGWTGSASYQFGSFNTHRITGNINYANEKSGLYVVVGGFYDYSDNDYKIDVAIPNERGQLEPKTVRRFHDGYQAYGNNLRIGIRHKKWANELSLEGYYGDYDNEVQNSQAPGLIDQPSLGIEKAVASNPFGEVLFTTLSEGVKLHYDVDLSSQWWLDLKAGLNYNEWISIDTSHNLYNWYGEVVRVNNQPGEFGEADHMIIKSENYFARQLVEYSISDEHVLKFTLAPTCGYQTGDDLLIDGKYDPALDKGYFFDLVSGLEYSGKLMTGKLKTIAFAKNYRQNIRIEGIDPSEEDLQVEKRSVSNYGAGSGLRYAWTHRFATKLSYEYAYRLPRQSEIFGNGQLIGTNTELVPENSHNVNLEWSLGSKPSSKTEWQVQGNFFLRRVNNLIFLVTNSEGFGVYDNVWSANSQGVELGGKVKGLLKGMSFNANTTYQSYFNTSDEGPFASFKGDRIPNTPYFFANGGAQYELEDLIQEKDRLTIFWSIRYVHPYFIGWESAGLPQFKAGVSSQVVQSAGITHRINLKDTQTSLTLEAQNLTNAKVFDLYGVQRPGRALYLKLTTQF